MQRTIWHARFVFDEITETKVAFTDYQDAIDSVKSTLKKNGYKDIKVYESRLYTQIYSGPLIAAQLDRMTLFENVVSDIQLQRMENES